jgi:GNAT superfamily N-acetyltransferase
MRRVGSAALVASASAALAFGLHHLSPGDPHHLEGVAALVFGAMLLVALPVALLTARRHPDPPAVIVPRKDSIAVREFLGPDDVRVAAALHAAELSHGFFVQLGPQFLREYERAFADSPHAVGLVAEIDGHVIGMLVGTYDRPRHIRWLLQRRGVLLAGLGAASLALRPLVAVRFMRERAARYARRWRDRGASVASGPPVGSVPAVLEHVAVARGARGTGAGSALVAAFEDQAARHGCREMRLFTLPATTGAGAFYARLGWVRTGSATTADGTAFDVYDKPVPC